MEAVLQCSCISMVVLITLYHPSLMDVRWLPIPLSWSSSDSWSFPRFYPGLWTVDTHMDLEQESTVSLVIVGLLPGCYPTPSPFVGSTHNLQIMDVDMDWSESQSLGDYIIGICHWTLNLLSHAFLLILFFDYSFIDMRHYSHWLFPHSFYY